MAGRVEGKVAFITGAARGQGRSHAVRLAEEGASIVVLDHCQDFETVNYPMASSADLKETVRLVEEAGGTIVAVEGDVRSRSDVVGALEQGVSTFGKIDVVVANAGIASMRGNPPMQAWVDQVDVNLLGVINTIHAALPLVPDGASLIATGSAAAFMNIQGTQTPGKDPGGAGYTYAKQALTQFMYTVAAQVAPRQIRANTVHPTNCHTDMLASKPMYQAFRPDLEDPTWDDAVVAFPAQQAFPVPYVEAIDISQAVLWLASDESRYVTGQQIRIDAGSYLKFNNLKI